MDHQLPSDFHYSGNNSVPVLLILDRSVGSLATDVFRYSWTAAARATSQPCAFNVQLNWYLTCCSHSTATASLLRRIVLLPLRQPGAPAQHGSSLSLVG